MPTFAVIQQDQYPATDETQCIQIIIPAGDEYKALLAGLMSLAANIDNYAEPDSVQAEGISTIWQDATASIIWDACP